MFSCNHEFDPQISYDLNGKWDIIKATRNGKETKTLKSGYFEFDSISNSITSNIFQVPEDKTYVIEKNVISVTGKEKMTFRILGYSNDSLHLASKIWKYDMQFLLIKEDSLTIDSLEI
jgi:hypothetical protein